MVWTGPFGVIPMPINAEGQGPSAPDDTVDTLYEVWDMASNMTVATFDNVVDAIDLEMTLNEVAGAGGRI